MNSPFDTLLPPWLHLVGADISALTDWVHALLEQDRSSIVRFFRGRKMQSERALFDEVSAAFQFPYYFGENWDALGECLGDLSWLPGRSYLAVVTDAEHVLTDAPSDFETFVGLLSHLGGDWSKAQPKLRPWASEPRPFHVILNVSPTNMVSFKSKLQQTGIEFSETSLDIRPTS